MNVERRLDTFELFDRKENTVNNLLRYNNQLYTPQIGAPGNPLARPGQGMGRKSVTARPVTVLA